jgi:hypothetical protein
MATAAAAVVARARREVISHFMQENAVDSATASRWIPDRALQQRMLARFVRRGVVVETAPDTYYLDLPAYDDWKRTVRKRAAFALLGVLLVGGALAAL